MALGVSEAQEFPEFFVGLEHISGEGRRLCVLRLPTAETGSLRLAVPNTCPGLSRPRPGSCGVPCSGLAGDRAASASTPKEGGRMFRARDRRAARRFEYAHGGRRSLMRRAGRALLHDTKTGAEARDGACGQFHQRGDFQVLSALTIIIIGAGVGIIAGLIGVTMKRRKWGWWAGPIRLPGGARLEADRSVGQSLLSTFDPKDKAEIEAMVARKDTIRAIRRVRELTGLRLIDAAKLVDSLQP